jgi:hypothetical protein
MPFPRRHCSHRSLFFCVLNLAVLLVLPAFAGLTSVRTKLKCCRDRFLRRVTYQRETAVEPFKSPVECATRIFHTMSDSSSDSQIELR